MAFFFGWLILAVVVACIASSRGRSWFGHFLIALCLSPLIALIIVLCLQNKVKAAEEHRRHLETLAAIANRKE